MGQTLPLACGDWAATKAAYRFLDNDAAEHALRRIGIGRKNWLFAGHDVAAQRTATLYILITSAERHGLDPQTYFTGVLARIPSMPVTQLKQFLPDRWKGAMASDSTRADHPSGTPQKLSGPQL